MGCKALQLQDYFQIVDSSNGVITNEKRSYDSFGRLLTIDNGSQKLSYGIAVGAWMGMITSGMIGVAGYIGGAVGAIITGISVYRSSMQNGGNPPSWLCSYQKKE